MTTNQSTTDSASGDMREQLEECFSLRISSSGNDITIRLGGQSMTVDYEVFLALRQRLEKVVESSLAKERQRLLAALPDKKTKDEWFNTSATKVRGEAFNIVHNDVIEQIRSIIAGGEGAQK